MLSRALRALVSVSDLPLIPAVHADVTSRLSSGVNANLSSAGKASAASQSPWQRHHSFEAGQVDAAADGSTASTSGRSDVATASSPFAGAAAHEPTKSTGASGASPASSTSTSAAGPDPELLRLLLHPFPKTGKYHGLLSQHLDSVHGQWYLDPEASLRSMVRALYVVKHLLRQDAHILVVNTNKLMKPLMQEAAACCLNPNVWFMHDRWTPGTLTNPHHTRTLFRPAHQPSRKLFAAKGLRMTNPHAPAGDASTGPQPAMPSDDKWALFDLSVAQAAASPTTSAAAERLLVNILSAEQRLARADIPGSLPGRLAALRLMVVLDPTHNSIALREAEQTNVLTIGLVNHNSTSLPSVTFPVYARDNNPNFQHFFLDWLLKVANVDVDSRRGDQVAAAAAAAAAGSA